MKNYSVKVQKGKAHYYVTVGAMTIAQVYKELKAFGITKEQIVEIKVEI
jgi:hypothetical protein